MDIGEFELIDLIGSDVGAVPAGIIGIGDDCAVIPQRSGLDTLVSTDMLVEGVHFLMDDVTPERLGWKSAAVNLSDIAAMGGRPTSTFLSIALSSGLSSGWVRRFMSGYRSICEEYGVPLLGGDTTSSRDSLCINVTVLGSIESGTAKLRSAAVPGDLICVTGYLGDSAGGLRAILRGLRADELVERHYRPRPRVAEGLCLAHCDGVHAMMDISDGIASDLRHILAASGVGAEVDTGCLPLSSELSAFCKCHGFDIVELAVCGGEDYELLFTVSPDCEPSLPVGHTVIGSVVESSSGEIRWLGTDKDYLGFRHF